MSQSANQQFSFARFGRLFSRHTAEHLPAYLMAAAVLAGAMLVVMGFVTYLQRSAPTVSAQQVFFILFLLASGSVFASNLFAQFGDRRQATAALTLPASHLEKYLVVWLYSVPIFLLVFVPLFYLVTAAVVYGGAAPGQEPALLNPFAGENSPVGTLLFFAMFQAMGLWGAIFFEKAHFIKTAFVVFGLLAVLSTLNYQALKLLLVRELRFMPPFTDAMFTEGKQLYSLALPDAQAHWLALVPLALAGLLWLAAYARITEKQL